VRRRRLSFILTVQAILLVLHAIVCLTWIEFWGIVDPHSLWRLGVLFAILSVSFLSASLLAFRYHHVAVRMFYTVSAVWLGIVNYFLLASCACWILDAGATLAGIHGERRTLMILLFSLALLAVFYGIVNAAHPRIRHISVKLPNLPESWRGRTAALLSDTHLGPVRGSGFARRVVAMVAQLRPDVVFLAGDVYDGTSADADQLARPFADLSAPLGAYFVTGNHEEFSDHTKYLEALKGAGVRVLHNEKVVLDGLQVVGVLYRDSVRPQHFESILRQAAVDRSRACILLTHVPRHLAIVAAQGISLQLSGHTHRGQFFPYTRIVSRIYGPFAYGLHRFETLAVYTSCGAGTWGPPMRVGTHPEVALIHFQ
jgi:uncharacterized protein